MSKNESKALDSIREAYETWWNDKYEWQKNVKKEKPTIHEAWFLAAKSIAKKLNYTSNDILEFSKQLKTRFDPNAQVRGRLPNPGYFLSALVNLAREDEITLDVRGCPGYLGYLDHFGYLNEKKIRIKGDVGDGLGEMMKKGEIIVEGNAGSNVGKLMDGGKIVVRGNVGAGAGVMMRGGEIRIEGDAEILLGCQMLGGIIVVEGNGGREVGVNMEGGTIVVKGNADWEVGANMKGGEIRVDGTIKGIGYGEHGEDKPKGGKIYEKGKLVYPKR